MGDDNESNSLAEYVKQCGDVAELHEIAKEKFGETIHNRTGLDKSRERVLELIENADANTDQAHQSPDDTQTNAEPAGNGNQDPAVSAQATPVSPSLAPNVTPDPAPKVRKLKNKRTGHTFIYTKALATNRDMVEV